MKRSILIRLILFSLALFVAGCSQYSTVREKRIDYQSASPAGQLIAAALKRPLAEPEERIGHFLDATAAASGVLANRPDNAQALADYNFSVARIFETINESGLEPWKTPLHFKGASRVWLLSFNEIPQLGDLSLSNFRIRPADRYRFKGRLVVQQAEKEGLGAPLVMNTKDFDLTEIDSFAQGRRAYYGVTGLVNIKGARCTVDLLDPLSVETVSMNGRTFPLGADFKAAIAFALAELQPRKNELKSLFKPEESATGARLARLQPYDPNKIPLLCIHGLGDSQATWAPMIESLQTDPVIRAHYQTWFFSYPTGNPYPVSAAVLRKEMDAIAERHPNHKKLVVLGHSMGGMISRTLMTDSGMSLWNAIYDKPPAEMPFSPETREFMTNVLIFEHRREIDRVIFCSPSHRGADLATQFWGRFGSKLIGSPTDLLNGDISALTLAKENPDGQKLTKVPNSVDLLDPNSRFVRGLALLPLAEGIPFHSILGDRGKGGNLDRTPPVSSDGIVPYWSSHLDGADSEVIIPSGHWTNQHPAGIEEVRRILYLHLGKQ